MQRTPAHKTKTRSTKGLAGKFAVATLLALITPTRFVFAASIWDNITSWGKGALSAVADFGMDLLLTPIVWIAHFINSAANLFMLGMGYMLDQSISYTLDSSIYKSVSAIQVGWTAVRDFSNMFFIFILLYIAIITILGMAKSSTKTLVAHVIISALLINFSLFFTQVVIDAGNILALGFWNKMITQQGTVSGPSASAFFMEGFRVQTEFDSVTDGTGAKVKITKSTEIMIYLGGAAVSFVAGYVFLAGAVMMIIRSVTLMILMITSPFAFLSFGLPKRGEFWGKWTGQLVGATFMAPAFIFMLYIDMLIIRGTGTGGELIKASGADTGKFALAFAGQVTNFSVIYNFVLMIVLLLAALTVANSVSSGAGSQAGGWAKKLIGGGAAMGAAGAAMYGRQTIGALGRGKMQDEKWVREQNRLVAKAGMKGADRYDKFAARSASAKLALAQGASKGTYDVRNAKVAGVGINTVLAKTGTGVNIGEGSKKNFETGGAAFSAIGGYRGTDKEKELIATAKARFPDDPAAQKAYIERKGVELKKIDGVVDRNKDVRESLDKEIKTKKDKAELKDELEKYKQEGAVVGEAVAENIQKLFTQLGPKESLEALALGKESNWTPKQLENIAPLIGRQHVSQMASDPEKYGTTLAAMTGTLMKSGSDDTRNYIIQQNKLGNPQLKINASKELQDRVDSYSNMPPLNDKMTPQEREKYFADKEKHDIAIQNLVGAMSPKEVARLDNNLKSNEAMVRNYTNKHFDEIESYHKNIKMDADKPEQVKMFGDIRNNASTKGNKATQKYMNESSKKENSAYYDKSAKEKAKANIDELKAKQQAALDKQAAAESKAFQANIMGDAAGKAAAEKEVADAKTEHDNYKSKVEKAEKAETKTEKDSSSDEEDDEA